MRGFWVAIFFMQMLPLSARQLNPWYGRDLEFHPRASYAFQWYDTLDEGGHSAGYGATGHFLDLTMEGSYAAYSVEVGTLLAGTRSRSFGFDNGSLTGRYRLLSDIEGDFVSLAAGLTLSGCPEEALTDISSFHHGKFESEFHLAIGREQPCLQYWTSRWWGVAAVGMADRGSPWLRGDFHWEKNDWDRRRYGISILTLWGLGGQDLDRKDFDGYGPVAHRSIDLGGYCTIESLCDGSLTFRYFYRVFARNFPAKTHIAVLEFFYPFGL